MGIRDSYVEMISKFTDGWQGACKVLGFTRPALTNRVYGNKGSTMSVELAMTMQALSDTTLFAEAIAEASGGTFVRLPETDIADDDELQGKFHALYAELGRLSQAYTAAAADGEIDKRERAELSLISNNIHKTMRELMGVMFRLYCREQS
jgi:hypothetical protein